MTAAAPDRIVAGRQTQSAPFDHARLRLLGETLYLASRAVAYRDHYIFAGGCGVEAPGFGNPPFFNGDAERTSIGHGISRIQNKMKNQFAHLMPAGTDKTPPN
jgi:hypothetical protein